MGGLKHITNKLKKQFYYRAAFLIIINYIKTYWFSFVLWQMISTEKEKASANAIVSQSDCCLTMETISITRQNRLTITVKAFFSDRYFFIINNEFYKGF